MNEPVVDTTETACGNEGYAPWSHENLGEAMGLAYGAPFWFGFAGGATFYDDSYEPPDAQPAVESDEVTLQVTIPKSLHAQTVADADKYGITVEEMLRSDYELGAHLHEVLDDALVADIAEMVAQHIEHRAARHRLAESLGASRVVAVDQRKIGGPLDMLALGEEFAEQPAPPTQPVPDPDDDDVPQPTAAGSASAGRWAGFKRQFSSRRRENRRRRIAGHRADDSPEGLTREDYLRIDEAMRSYGMLVFDRKVSAGETPDEAHAERDRFYDTRRKINDLRRVGWVQR